jgi:DNA-binding transcriptional regulator LsrR (DeoR family)
MTARMLTRVARMYHEEGLPQREIAVRLSLSQSRVSRMLRHAADVGIVRTVVTPPPEVHADLEDELRDAYGLRDAVVVDDDSPPALGAATAAYLDATVRPGERIGIASWSATLMAASDAMSAPVAARAEEVTQLVGGVGDPAVQFRATGLTARLAELTGARAVPLPAPGLLRSAALRDALVLDPAVAGVMGGWDELTLALVGIGGLEPSALLEQSGNAICAAELEDLRARGAVGDICFRFFDADGTPVPSPLDDRVLGIAPERLHAVARRVGVAGGEQKYHAIRAALRGAWINVLVTDAETALRLVSERARRFDTRPRLLQDVGFDESSQH